LPTSIIVLAVLPALLICYGIFHIDRYEKEGLLPLCLCFGLGVLATFPAVLIERWGFYYADGLAATPRVLVNAFLVIAANEEAWKLLALLLGAFVWQFFNEPVDGIVYAVMIGMGFATAENFVYAQYGMETLVLRAFTAVPAHLFFAIVMGYYMGVAKFSPTEQQMQMIVKAFGYTVLMHGIYDVLILQHWSRWLPVFAAIALYQCLFFSGRLINEHLFNSPFRPKGESQV
jgi:protease PrsW